MGLNPIIAIFPLPCELIVCIFSINHNISAIRIDEREVGKGPRKEREREGTRNGEEGRDGERGGRGKGQREERGEGWINSERRGERRGAGRDGERSERVENVDGGG